MAKSSRLRAKESESVTLSQRPIDTKIGKIVKSLKSTQQTVEISEISLFFIIDVENSW